MIEIDPKPITRAATNLETQQAGSAKKIKMDDPLAASKAHPTWEATLANDPCVAAWRTRLHDLGESARKAAAELNKSMDNYVMTDATVADGLAKSSRWLRGA